jgi:hypothetical protein
MSFQRPAKQSTAPSPFKKFSSRIILPEVRGLEITDGERSTIALSRTEPDCQIAIYPCQVQGSNNFSSIIWLICFVAVSPDSEVPKIEFVNFVVSLALPRHPGSPENHQNELNKIAKNST